MKYLNQLELDEGSNELTIFISPDGDFFANDCEIAPQVVEPLLVEALSCDNIEAVTVVPLPGRVLAPFMVEEVVFSYFYGDFHHNGRLIVNMPVFLDTCAGLGRVIEFTHSQED